MPSRTLLITGTFSLLLHSSIAFAASDVPSDPRDALADKLLQTVDGVFRSLDRTIEGLPLSEPTKEETQQTLKTRHDTVKNSINNIRA